MKTGDPMTDSEMFFNITYIQSNQSDTYCFKIYYNIALHHRLAITRGLFSIGLFVKFFKSFYIFP